MPVRKDLLEVCTVKKGLAMLFSSFLLQSKSTAHVADTSIPVKVKMLNCTQVHDR